MPSPLPLLETERLSLSVPPPDDAPRLLEFYGRNREHFARWDPRRTPEFYTESWWRNQLAINQREFAEGKSVRLVLTARDDPGGPVVGIANYSAILRGCFQACFLGFSLDAGHEGQGFMREALEESIAYVFGTVGLHRIMANYQPANARSANLLGRLGFKPEGFAKDYLFIDGAWRDHVLTALTHSDPGPQE